MLLLNRFSDFAATGPHHRGQLGNRSRFRCQAPRLATVFTASTGEDHYVFRFTPRALGPLGAAEVGVETTFADAGQLRFAPLPVRAEKTPLDPIRSREQNPKELPAIASCPR